MCERERERERKGERGREQERERVPPLIADDFQSQMLNIYVTLNVCDNLCLLFLYRCGLKIAEQNGVRLNAKKTLPDE